MTGTSTTVAGSGDPVSDAGAHSAVKLIGLRRRYDEVVAVDGVDLEIGDGEFFSLIGPSGCGKTTTLRMIAGLVEPTDGRIEVHGRNVTDVRPHKRPVNTVFQQYALFPHLTVFENVAFGLRERRAPKAEIARRVAEMLEIVGLQGREGYRPSQLSGGQQQRVALARSLVLDPEVLLLDEPLGALDLKLRKALQLQLKRIQHEVGITFVYVTHDQEEAFFMSNRVAIMRDGRIEQLGTPRDVYERPRTEFVADFVGAANRLEGRIVAVLDNGRYDAEVTGVGRIQAAGVEGLQPGADVRAIVRPEAISTGPVQPGQAGISARLTDIAYLGHHVACVAHTADGGQLSISMPQAHATLVVGADCTFRWPFEAIWLLAAESGAPPGVTTSDQDAAALD